MKVEQDIKSLIIGVDNQLNVAKLKLLSGEVLSVQEVREKLKNNQKFVALLPSSATVVDVVAEEDGTLVMRTQDGSKASLGKLPTFY